MADLFLVVDTGGSQTKIIYQRSNADSPHYLFMPPEVERISPQQLQLYQERLGWLGAPAPQQQAWLTVNDEVWVVGAFANEFDPQNRLHEKKYENALYKVLATIGVLVQKLNLPSPKLTIQLGILLPWQEFNDQKSFQGQLRSMLANFQFRNLKLKVKLEAFICRPEGGGLAATRMRQQGIDWFQQQRLVVLLFGHRNTSALYFEHGQFKHGDSPLYGFSQMVNLVLERCSLLDSHALLMALVKTMSHAKSQHIATSKEFYGASMKLSYPRWSGEEQIKALATARTQTLRDTEIKAIAQAIETALDLYWQKLETWLNRVVPRPLDEAIISGGAALFLKPKLEAYFSDHRRRRSFYCRVAWDANLEEPLQKAFRPGLSGSWEEAARLADAYGLFDQLLFTAAEGAKA
ncbi:MAG: ParM/StbA family protein [Cyanobacteria bacterium P01_G01_bin.38]